MGARKGKTPAEVLAAKAKRRQRRCDLTPVWAARVLAFAAFWALVALPIRPMWPRVFRVVRIGLDAVNLPSNPSLFVFAALTVLAIAIRHRKRVAMWVVIGVVQLPAIIYAVVLGAIYLAGGDWRSLLSPSLGFRLQPWTLPIRVGLAALVAIAITWWLLAHRSAFAARTSSRSVIRAALTLIAGLGASAVWAFAWSAAIGTKSASLVAKAWWSVNIALGQGPEEVVTGSGIAGRPIFHHLFGDPMAPLWVVRTTNLWATLALLIALIVFMRTDHQLPAMDADQELALRELLLRYGDQDSLGYFNSRRDKSVIFSA
ncbi:MAG: hypothetical protein LBH68_05460, partial [Bifidobacteriaceae bacterium]|nr:hypothetical protein [Bifidobacteriaceae bacterium]